MWNHNLSLVRHRLARKPVLSLLGPRLSMSISSSSSIAVSPEDVMKHLTTPPYVLPNHKKIVAAPMVYISGEEMTHYTMQLIMEQWIAPHIDIRQWSFFDLSCRSRDATDDRVLHDAVAAGKLVGSIFKEPTVTPSALQAKEMGLKKAWGSPNGAMRRGWNGITISRDTIHIEGVKLGFEKPVLFERHAVGGEYGAGWKSVGAGRLVTTFFPRDGSTPIFCDDRLLEDSSNVVVTYHNPLDNVEDLAHHFFSRCLSGHVVPYVVTKKTVFKWQEGFWKIMKDVFDSHYREAFMQAGLVKDGELQHLISDAATMQIIRWKKGGFGMAAHNYDGDMLTDEVAQMHRSPGFITSNLIGKKDDGTLIKEYEASHGTVADLWAAHLRGEETSLNPLGMVEALLGAMEHSADLSMAPANASPKEKQESSQRCKQIKTFIKTLRSAMHNTFRYGQGTRDMAGPDGLTTEAFIDKVAWRLGRYTALLSDDVNKQDIIAPPRSYRRNYDVDKEAVQQMFDEYDSAKTGFINVGDLERLLVDRGLAPTKRISRGPSSTG